MHENAVLTIGLTYQSDYSIFHFMVTLLIHIVSCFHPCFPFLLDILQKNGIYNCNNLFSFCVLIAIVHLDHSLKMYLKYKYFLKFRSLNNFSGCIVFHWLLFPEKYYFVQCTYVNSSWNIFLVEGTHVFYSRRFQVFFNIFWYILFHLKYIHLGFDQNIFEFTYEFSFHYFV